MKNRVPVVVAALFLVAMFGSSVAAEAHGSRVYFGFTFGVGTPYYGGAVYGYYPGCYTAYQPYFYQGYNYGPYYPPPVVYRPYVPYGARVYRGHAPYYYHGRYGRAHVYRAPYRYGHRH